MDLRLRSLVIERSERWRRWIGIRGWLRALVVVVAAAALVTAADDGGATDDQPLSVGSSAEDRAVGPFTVGVHAVAGRIRAGAPWWLDVRLGARDHLRSGRLEIAWKVEDQEVGRWTSDEWTLTASIRDSVVVMPAFQVGNDGVITAEITWHGDDGDHDLGRQDLTLPYLADRELVIGLVLPDSIAHDPPWRLVTVDRCQPGTQQRASMKSVLARLARDRLPDQPVDYCAFDLLAIDGDALGALRPAQAAAIATWVRAGGALCVFSDDIGHVAFPGLELPAGEADGQRRARCGLGVVAVVPREATEDGTAWWTTTAFLWRLRDSVAQAVRDHGAWDEEPQAANGQYSPDRISIAPHADALLVMQMAAALRPPDFRTVPLWAVLAIVAGFIVVIGPLDWWALGRLRRRRWTWMAFPVVAVAITWATVAVSRAWLGDVGSARSLTVVDLAADGTPLRTNVFELRMAGHACDQDIDCRDELLADITQGEAAEMGWARNSGRYGYYGYNGSYPYGYGQGRSDAVARFAACAGTLPGRYTASVHLPQWSPVLLRRMRFAGAAPDWKWPRSLADRDAWQAAFVGTTTVVAWDPQNGSTDHLCQGAHLEGDLPARLYSDPSRDSSQGGGGYANVFAATAVNGGPEAGDLAVVGPAIPGAPDDGTVIVSVIASAADGFLIVRRPYPRNGERPLSPAEAAAAPPPEQEQR